jgi:hypothetical protein
MQNEKVWKFPRLSTDQALGVQGYRGRFVIYLADNLNGRQRQHILSSLGSP